MVKQENGMVVETNTTQESLPYRIKFACGVSLFTRDGDVIARSAGFERFMATVEGEYYIDAGPDLSWSHAEFSDKATAERFNCFMGGRIHRDGTHALIVVR